MLIQAEVAVSQLESSLHQRFWFFLKYVKVSLEKILKSKWPNSVHWDQ